MRWSTLWRGARRITDDRLYDLVPSKPAERLGWDALLWPALALVGVPIVVALCR